MINLADKKECRLVQDIIKRSFRDTDGLLSVNRYALRVSTGNCSNDEGKDEFTLLSDNIAIKVQSLIDDKIIRDVLNYKEEDVEIEEYNSKILTAIKFFVREQIQYSTQYLFLFVENPRQQLVDLLNKSYLYAILTQCSQRPIDANALQKVIRKEIIITELYQEKLCKIISEHTSSTGLISINHDTITGYITDSSAEAVQKNDNGLSKQLIQITTLIRGLRTRGDNADNYTFYLQLLSNIIQHQFINLDIAQFRVSTLDLYLHLTKYEEEPLLNARKAESLRKKISQNLSFDFCIQPFHKIGISVVKISFYQNGTDIGRDENMIVIYDYATQYIYSSAYLTGDVKQGKLLLRNLLYKKDGKFPGELIVSNSLKQMLSGMETIIAEIGSKISFLENFHLALVQYIKCCRLPFDEIRKYEFIDNTCSNQLTVGLRDHSINQQRGEIIDEVKEVILSLCLTEFNSSKKYKDHGMASPKDCLNSMRSFNSVDITPKQFIALFGEFYECKVRGKVCFVEASNHVFWFVAKKKLSPGLGTICMDLSNPSFGCHLYLCDNKSEIEYYGTSIRDDEEVSFPRECLPTIMNVRSAISELIRTEFNILPPTAQEKLDGHTRVLRKLKKRAYERKRVN